MFSVFCILYSNNFCERLLHHLILLLEIRMTYIHHVHQQIGFPHLIQRRLERLYQVVRQFPDKTDRVTQQERQILYRHLANGGVQRRKQLILREHLALAQQVHQRRFAHIGITHQRHAYHLPAVLTLRRHLLVYRLQLLAQQGDSLTYHSFVGLYLRLTHTAVGASAAALAVQVTPHARQTRQHVLQMRHLYLRLRVTRLRALQKNLQNQYRPVDHPHIRRMLLAPVDGFFEVSYLPRAQLVIKDMLRCFIQLDELTGIIPIGNRLPIRTILQIPEIIVPLMQLDQPSLQILTSFFNQLIIRFVTGLHIVVEVEAKLLKHHIIPHPVGGLHRTIDQLGILVLRLFGKDKLEQLYGEHQRHTFLFHISQCLLGKQRWEEVPWTEPPQRAHGVEFRHRALLIPAHCTQEVRDNVFIIIKMEKLEVEIRIENTQPVGSLLIGSPYPIVHNRSPRHFSPPSKSVPRTVEQRLARIVPCGVNQPFSTEMETIAGEVSNVLLVTRHDGKNRAPHAVARHHPKVKSGIHNRPDHRTEVIRRGITPHQHLDVFGKAIDDLIVFQHNISPHQSGFLF